MTTRILVIEDEPDILELYRMLLETEGYEVYTHDTVYNDLTAIKQIKPHLIILDLMIGGKEAGWKYLEMVHQHPDTSFIPLLLSTAGDHQLREKIDALKTPSVDVVFKPFDVEELLQVIQNLLALAPLETC
ncbi:hypothetical protein KDA_60970 [Dictyobacter alpinus]|uniref:Response regulatory domain-containing protein n=1 Tax=Dictyobacter alpinus TaxID=2014873 RepID=A0A402BGW4_9CHLR|nr:response regulator [Dictyobacter alpinus]GCE30613.1 hypothetical protein KDA_60970 [Dictyobacter alpinus]